MSWAIERDSTGRPARMIYMGDIQQATLVKEPATGCVACGFHFGWHKLGCTAKHPPQPCEGQK